MCVYILFLFLIDVLLLDLFPLDASVYKPLF